MARIQLARALAMAGDRANAKAAYADFLNLWKDSDPGIPLLKEAKAVQTKPCVNDIDNHSVTPCRVADTRTHSPRHRFPIALHFTGIRIQPGRSFRHALTR